MVADVMRGHREGQEVERLDLAERWPDPGFVFTTPIGTPIDPRNCTRVLQTACKTAGVRVIRLHDFRHGCVGAAGPRSAAADGKGDRRALDDRDDMNVYGHVTLDEKREALDKLGTLFEEEK